MRSLGYSLLILGLCSLVACGFQLRGMQYELEIEEVYLSGSNTRSELLEEITENFRDRGIAISASNESVPSLHIVSEDIHRRPIATGADISVSEYELRMEVVFQIMSDEGKVLIPPSTLFLERIYSFDRSSLVGSSEEENIVVQEMRRDLANQLLLRLYSAIQRNA